MSKGETFGLLALGAAIALVFNATITGIANTVLSPLGITYV